MVGCGAAPNEMTAGFKAVQTRGRPIRQAERRGSIHAGELALASAKDIQDVLALQTHYAQSQMQTYALQAQK